MKLILIDGYGFVFRAFHSLPALTRAKDGVPIGAILGFCNMMYKFVTQNETDMIAVVLDSGQKTFRHEIYPQYKANRPEAPQELIVQFPIIREAIEAFNIKALEKPGFEADDLIASYALEAIKQGYEVEVVSSDKDLMQLLAYGVRMYDAMKDRAIGEEEVLKKFGVNSSKVREVLALIGDSSDNIPGVRGIGPKTAAELIGEYQTLEGIYNNLDHIKQAKRRQMLIEDKENAFLSYKLVELKSDMALDIELIDLKNHKLDYDKLSSFLKEQGFKNLLNRLPVSHSKPSPNNVKFTALALIAEVKQLIKDIEYHGILYFYHDANLLTLTIGDNNYLIKDEITVKQEMLFEPEDHHPSLTIKDALNALQPVFESLAIKVVSVNCKEFSKRLLNAGCQVNVIEDIGIIAYALETGVGDNSFNNLIERFGLSEPERNSNTVKILHEILMRKLLDSKHVSLYERIDKKMLLLLAKMELKGIKLDVSYLKSLSIEFNLKLQSLEEKIFQITGKQFNIGSPKQLGEILFADMKLGGGRKTKMGAFITSAQVLENLAEEGYEIASLILEWRQYAKLVSTYTEALPKAMDSKTHRVHTTFMMTATSTGRLSSHDPNLQNIPIRTDEGHKIRKAFIAEQGKKIISADYSQIELRLLAHFANINSLKDAFKNGVDIHAITASQIFNIELNQVDASLRRQAKTINFGIIYGISAYGLARRLGIGREVAKQYIESYFRQYPGIKEYMDEKIEYARTHGYVETFFGRKCYIPGINDKNQGVKGNAERAAINFPLQGTAADIIKKAMVMLPDFIVRDLLLQIHDELLFEVEEDQVEQAKGIIKQTMEQAIRLSVPITVDIRHGNTWMESH